MPPKIYTETPLEPDKTRLNEKKSFETIIPPEDDGLKQQLVRAIKEAKNPLNRRAVDFPWLDPDVLWFLDLALEKLHRQHPALFKNFKS